MILSEDSWPRNVAEGVSSAPLTPAVGLGATPYNNFYDFSFVIAFKTFASICTALFPSPIKISPS
jgi:hypothetical protein